MLAFRIVLAGAIAALAAPAAAFATNADGATPTATPLLVGLVVVATVAVGLLAHRPLARLTRTTWSWLAHRHASQRRPSRISGR